MSWRAWLAFTALCCIWGIPYFFVKLAVRELSPFLIAGGRVTLGALLLLPIAAQRGALHPLRHRKAAVLGFAVAEFVVPFSAIAAAERWISSSVTGILIAAVPMTIALIARFFDVREPLSTQRLIGLIVGFLGVACLVGLGTVSGPNGWLGVGCTLLATLGYAIGPLIVQRHLSDLDPVGPTAASLSVGSLILLPLALSSLPHAMPSGLALSSMLVLGAVCTALGMVLMLYLIGHAGAGRASIIAYINPAVAALLGASLLHERLGPAGLLGLVMILVGSWWATRGPRLASRTERAA